jgi:signal transduction histidine kinase/CheY-like chemotaxis protein
MWWGGRANAHERVVAVYAVVFLLSLAALPMFGGWFRVVTNVLYFGIGVATAWSQWQAANRLRDEPAARRAWTLLAISSVTLLVSGSIWTVWLAVTSAPFPPLVELLLDVSYIPMAFAAFLSFPVRQGFSLRDPKVRLDAALFVLGGVALSSHFALRPVLSDAAAVSFNTLILIVAEWGLAIVATIALLRAASERDRVAIGYLLAAHLLYILTEYFWGLSRGQYVPGHWVDGFWFSAWLLRWVGSRHALRAREDRETTDAGLGPSLFVAGAYLLLVVALLVEPQGGVVDIALAAAAMTALLVARQRVALKENMALARDTAALAARFKAMATSAADFVLVVNAAHQVTYASPSFERVTEEKLSSPASLDALLHLDDRPSFTEWLDAQSGTTVRRVHRCRLRVGSDAYREIEFRVQDRRSDPLIGGFVLNGRDISAELQLEAKLGHARKLATLSDMAGRIAHAFNNSLAVLQGHAELLMTELSPDAPAREDVRAIRAAAERGAGITRQLLGFSGRHVIRPEFLDPGEIAADLLHSIRRLLPRNVSVTLVREARRAVLLDRAQFEQVLLNLVANARDGMPQGGTIRIVVRDGAVPPGVERARRELEVLVADEGVGIPEELHARVFEPFFTTKPTGQGTGLGLAMVSSIIKRAGGRIDVQSEVGRGTTFCLTLPYGEEDPAPHLEPAPSAASPTAGAGTVLLVDDDPSVRRATARMAQRAGFSVLEAGSGPEALEIAGQMDRAIDVLLTDLMMPGMSGREVIARFRDVRPGIPVVCITGFAAEREEGSALALEVHAIVAKPFTSEALESALASALASAAASRSASGPS